MAQLKQYWLVKQEPEAYSWDTFVKEGEATWTGVRNFQARNNLRAMKKGDSVLFYHSVTDKKIVGLAKVSVPAFADPTATEGDWSAVKLQPVRAFKRPLTLEAIKEDALLKEMPLVRNSRLSVSPVTVCQFERILNLVS
jgi:predicted RNA-binding protein with PUA-like domain